MPEDQQNITAEYIAALLNTDITQSSVTFTEREAFVFATGAAWMLRVMTERGMLASNNQHEQVPSNLEPLLIELVRELRIQNDYHSRMERNVLSLSTHQLSQEKPEWVESSTHRENTSSIPEDELMYIDGKPYLKNNSVTPVTPKSVTSRNKEIPGRKGVTGGVTSGVTREQCVEYKREHPDAGYRTIGAALGVSHMTVKRLLES
jgi:hypothetical protein